MEETAMEDRAIGVNTHLAHHLAEVRLDREARGYHAALEFHLRTAEQKEEMEQRMRERRRYWQESQVKRAQEAEMRIHAPRREKQVNAQVERERRLSEFEWEALTKEAAFDSRIRALEASREESAQRRSAEAQSRDQEGKLVLARAQAIEADRILNECRRQEELSQRRAGVIARKQEERAQSADARRRYEERVASQMQAHHQQEEWRLWEKALSYEEKLDRISQMERKRDELMEDVERCRLRAAVTRDQVNELLQKAAHARPSEADSLRARLAAIIQEGGGSISSAGSPTTCASSQKRTPSAPAASRQRASNGVASAGVASAATPRTAARVGPWASPRGPAAARPQAARREARSVPRHRPSAQQPMSARLGPETRRLVSARRSQTPAPAATAAEAHAAAPVTSAPATAARGGAGGMAAELAATAAAVQLPLKAKDNGMGQEDSWDANTNIGHSSSVAATSNYSNSSFQDAFTPRSRISAVNSNTPLSQQASLTSPAASPSGPVGGVASAQGAGSLPASPRKGEASSPEASPHFAPMVLGSSAPARIQAPMHLTEVEPQTPLAAQQAQGRIPSTTVQVAPTRVHRSVAAAVQQQAPSPRHAVLAPSPAGEPAVLTFPVGFAGAGYPQVAAAVTPRAVAPHGAPVAGQQQQVYSARVHHPVLHPQRIVRPAAAVGAGVADILGKSSRPVQMTTLPASA